MPAAVPPPAVAPGPIRASHSDESVLGSSFVVPDEVLPDVPAALRNRGPGAGNSPAWAI